MTAREVILFGSYDADLHPRVAVLREGLAATEHVTEVNEPLGLSTSDKIAAASSLSGAWSLLVAIVRSWVALWRRARRCRTEPDLVVVGYMGHFDVHLARLLWRRATIALDHLVGLADTSRDRGVAGGLTGRLLDALDRAALRRADIVIVDTAEQLEHLPEGVRSKAVVIPVGATRQWFAAEPPPPAPPVRVCFVGLFTPLHGAPVIGEAVGLLAGDDRLEFTFVGTGQELDATRRAAAANPRVTWIDWVDHADLPALLATHHVTLGIVGTTPKALRVVPTKVYQGLAAGHVVITSDTAPQRRALGDAARYVPPGDAAALARTLEQVAAELIGLGDRSGEERREVAARFRPERVVEPLLDVWAGAEVRRGRERGRPPRRPPVASPSPGSR